MADGIDYGRPPVDVYHRVDAQLEVGGELVDCHEHHPNCLRGDEFVDVAQPVD